MTEPQKIPTPDDVRARCAKTREFILNNAFTQVVKELPINPQNAAIIAIVRAFARIVRSRRRPVHDIVLDADVQLPAEN
jgi:hypothetical protein